MAVILKAIFWASAAGLAWTHVGYPVVAAALRRVRERPVRKEEIEPTVDPETELYPYLTLLAGKENAKAAIRWAEQALELLERKQ